MVGRLIPSRPSDQPADAIGFFDHPATAEWCGNPFFRSYGARLPSSLTRFHSLALVYSTHPPVSVYGTGGHGNMTKVFLVFDLRNPLRPKSPRQLAPLPLSAGSSSPQIRHSVT